MGIQLNINKTKTNIPRGFIFGLCSANIFNNAANFPDFDIPSHEPPSSPGTKSTPANNDKAHICM